MSLLVLYLLFNRVKNFIRNDQVRSMLHPFRIILAGSFLVLSILLIHSCKQGKKVNAPDVSHIEPDFQLIRYDSLLRLADSTSLAGHIEHTYKDHPDFAEIYFRRVLHLRNSYPSDAESFLSELQQLKAAKEWRSLNDTVRAIIPDLVEIKDELTQAFRYYQYYFPEHKLPDVYTCLTEFGTATFLFEQKGTRDGLGISLDMFLGEQFDYTVLSSYSGTFAAFNARTLNRSHLVKKVMDVIIEDRVPPTTKFRMLDVLVDEGKKQYLRELLLPYHPDTVKWEYTAEQMEWVLDNEWNIYTFLISNDLLYSTDVNKYLRLIKPAPHSMDMPPEAPGRAVNYIGYLIVESFVKRNPEISLQEMLEIDDGQFFLEKGKYKPRK